VAIALTTDIKKNINKISGNNNIINNYNSTSSKTLKDKNNKNHIFITLNYGYSKRNSIIQDLNSKNQKKLNIDSLETVGGLKIGFGQLQGQRFELHYNKYSADRIGLGIGHTITANYGRFNPFVNFEIEGLIMDDINKYYQQFGGGIELGVYVKINSYIMIGVGYKYKAHLLEFDKDVNVEVCDSHSGYFKDCWNETQIEHKNQLEQFGFTSLNLLLQF